MEGTKYDAGKIRMELIPPSLLEGVGKVLTFGARKYDDRNWEKGIAWSRCYGALLRHLTAWWSGIEADAETGMSHLWHAGCCLAFLIEFERTHRELDDRPNKKAPEATGGWSFGDNYDIVVARYLSGCGAPPDRVPGLGGLGDATGEPYQSSSI